LKLFIGNLNYEATEADIATFFAEQSIEVQKVKLCSEKETGDRRGFGFLEVSDADAGRALDLSGASLMGRKLKIDRARAQRGKRQ